MPKREVPEVDTRIIVEKLYLKKIMNSEEIIAKICRWRKKKNIREMLEANEMKVPRKIVGKTKIE